MAVDTKKLQKAINWLQEFCDELEWVDNNHDIKIKYSKYVRMTELQYKKLNEGYWEFIIKNYIENLDNYMGSSGKKYKCHYRTILGWIKKDGTRKKQCMKNDYVEGPFIPVTKEELNKFREKTKPLLSKFTDEI